MNSCISVLTGTKRRPTIKTRNNKTELLNQEEGEDNMGDAVGKKKPAPGINHKRLLEI